MTQTFIPLSARLPLSHTIEKPAQGEEPVTFLLKRPSPTEKETLSATMFAAGLRQPETRQIRAAQIHALIKLLGDDAGEEAASKLEIHFARFDEYGRELLQWRARERERKIDEEAGAEPIEAEAPPLPAYTERERQEADLLTYQANTDPLVASLLSDRAKFNAQNLFWLVRAHVLPGQTTGLPDSLALQYGKDGLMTPASLDDLIDYIGNDAFIALAGAIDDQYSLPEEEEKNSESLPGTSSLAAQPSQEQSDGSEKPSGVSTASSTDPTPEPASDPTTAPSSNTPSDIATALPESSSPTADQE